MGDSYKARHTLVGKGGWKLIRYHERWVSNFKSLLQHVRDTEYAPGCVQRLELVYDVCNGTSTKMACMNPSLEGEISPFLYPGTRCVWFFWKGGHSVSFASHTPYHPCILPGPAVFFFFPSAFTGLHSLFYHGEGPLPPSASVWICSPPHEGKRFPPKS